MTYARKMANRLWQIEDGEWQVTPDDIEATIAEVIEACAQEAFSFDIDWSVGIAENLGKVGLAIRSLATTDKP